MLNEMNSTDLQAVEEGTAHYMLASQKTTASCMKVQVHRATVVMGLYTKEQGYWTVPSSFIFIPNTIV